MSERVAADEPQVRQVATIRRELSRVKAHFKRLDLSDRDRGELYGAYQTLAWVLKRDAAPPSTLPKGKG